MTVSTRLPCGAHHSTATCQSPHFTRTYGSFRGHGAVVRNRLPDGGCDKAVTAARPFFIFRCSRFCFSLREAVNAKVASKGTCDTETSYPKAVRSLVLFFRVTREKNGSST